MSIEQEIYDAVKTVLERESFVADKTPRYEKDERVNVLWLWAMENYERLYDPSKGNLEQWISGCRKRVIDCYRKDFQITRINKTFVTRDRQFYLTDDGESVEDIFYAAPPEKDMSYKEDIKPVYDVIEDNLSVDSAWILYQGYTNTSDDHLADAIGCSKVSLHSRRTLAKNKIRKILEDYEY
tara:strand:- start:492 stop:1037 length:546 start_codon:yes stop_codon:yes gene_type:complete